ncbi:hypothetical protein ACFQGT_10205 [Natrialbaceae archaeon GCM10025810]|uniref:hypothetical protein n=1 Tax=Halovalidus salilacus TaxID=3075124 RepID=UPI00360FF90F
MTTKRITSVETEVECPRCGEPSSVAVPDGSEISVRSTVAAFGDHETVTCSRGHRYWVYSC